MGGRRTPILCLFALKPLLTLDVALVLLKLFVLLATHVVHSLVGILLHLLHEFAEVHVLLVGHLFELSLNGLLPKLFHSDTGSGLGALWLTNLGELIVASRHIQSSVLIRFNTAGRRSFDDT